MEEKSKVIILDWGIFIFRSIFSWRKNKQFPPEYICMNMILASLRRIGVEPQDEIIIACDKGGSWRKNIDKEYKANRKAFRESYTDIDWEDMFKKFDNLLDKLNTSTNWYIVKAEGLEADDWMSGACRYFKDKDIVLVSFDGDIEQLAIYPNVKVFSPLIKFKGGKGAYKIVKNPYKVLAKKIEKETADNLNNPVLSAKDFEKRKAIVSLLELPEFVENQIKERFDNLGEDKTTQEDLDNIPFRTIKEKIGNLYNDKAKIVKYSECVEKRLKKLKRKKKKKKRRGNNEKCI